MNPLPSEADTPSHGLFSPEGVRLDLPVAGPAPRMFAYGIDLIVILLLLVTLAAALVLSLPIGNLADKWFASGFHEAMRNGHAGKPDQVALGRIAGIIVAMFMLAQYAVETGYFIFWEMTTSGRSLGKMVVGLRVVRRDGLPIDLRSSVVRNLMRIVDMLPENYVVGLVSMVLSASGQRLGDHAAGTVVIRLDRPEAAPEIPASQQPAALSLTREQLARMGPRELQLIRGTLRRAASLPADRREMLLDEVAETLRTRLELAELPYPDRLAFLRGLLTVAERYSRNHPR